ncbi:(deoxy)nucleoside triphosphate pyrophosphohydrolase [Corynebacterium wankanglinii]|uniref:8-oxo-dGTP diphosphatase n=1 Tax=Corynebacterium wankanglinii TaxID=2735136 RepID=A0A838CKF8_9CORY|nr:(deoxy)nucleoside triphosphate pyrophosphohydrolase [Corynebacterium wankanglinii]MBA1835518.1 (deoxy)nucleoside triphosphate pyrophosphohydrolase [Corynebacterium wankanglinii]
MTKRIEVVGAVLVEDGRVFAAKRGPGKSMAGYWEFPGGKIEPGETPQAALARELREELGIDVIVGPFLVSATHDLGTSVIELSTYMCQISSGNLTLTEHIQSRWITRSELNMLDWAPADLPTVELLKERLS